MDVQNTLIVARRSFSFGLNKHADLRNAALVALFQELRIKADFLIKNRAQLHAIAMPAYNESCSSHRVTQYHFHNLWPSAFLRFHATEKCGDNIWRLILKKQQ